jgi:proteasome lid subunit RPN8/RPN11
MPTKVRITRTVLDRMLAEARAHSGDECCGILAGRGGAITEILPAANALRSTTAYEIAPRDLFRIFRALREEGLEHLGIYHSHPSTENAPSPRDIELAYYPDAAYFILSPRGDAKLPVRAFRICEGVVTELDIEIVAG